MSQKIAKSDRDFVCQVSGWRLTTAEITYRMPDYRDLLQIFVWQAYDLAPNFPCLKRFLHHWSQHLEGPLCSVRVAYRDEVGAVHIPTIDQEWCLLH